jgi:hypothetical protein
VCTQRAAGSGPGGHAGGSVTGDNRCGGCSAVETPIEVITEASPKIDWPTVQTANALLNDALISSQPLARLNAKMKNAIDPREIADEERQQRAAPGSTTVDGDGTSKSRTAPPSENTGGSRRRGVEEDEDRPPGPDSKSTADNEPKDKASDERPAKVSGSNAGSTKN